MWYQFFLENTHYAINLLTALVMFGVGWLYYDAFKVKKNKNTFLKAAGFFLLTISFLISATFIESILVQKPIIAEEMHKFLITFSQVAGLILVLLGVIGDPLEPKPKKNSSVNAISIISSITLAPLVFYLQFLVPFLSSLVGFFYLKRATVGLENHLKPVSLSFFILSISQLFALGGLFEGTSNPDIYYYVSAFGPLWIIKHILLLTGTLFLLKWVFSYLFKSLDTEIFFIYVFSIVTIFLVTGITFSVLLVKNIEKDSVEKITTDVHVLKYALDGKIQELLSNSRNLGSNPETLEGLSDVTRISLKNLTNSYLNSFKLDSLIIVNENGQVIMRGEDSERFGDSLSSDTLVKRTLLGENTSGASLKEGILTSSIVLRAATPVYEEDKIKGAVITGVIIDNAFVDGIKNTTGLEASIYAQNKISATTLTNFYDQKRLIGLVENSKKVKEILDSKEPDFTGVVKIASVDYLASFLPVHDSDGNPVGLLSAQKPHVEVLKTAGTSLEITFIASVILIILSIIPTRLISKFIVSQIQ